MSMINSPTDNAQCVLKAADAFRRTWLTAGVDEPLHTAVILGSGLQGAADKALRHGAISVEFAKVPGMPVPQVEGHEGQLATGGELLNHCVLMQGRPHFFEGFSLAEVTFPVRLLAELGIRTLIVTNAAGGIRSSLQPGDLMIINDHLSLVDISPLRKPTEFGHIVCRRETCWSRRLLDIAQKIETTLRIHTGCYAMMPGPNYETPAEIRMLAALGADAVGMSSVPEAIVASQLGIEVMGVSCITNPAAGLSDHPIDHREIGDTAAGLESEFTHWLERLIVALGNRDPG